MYNFGAVQAKKIVLSQLGATALISVLVLPLGWVYTYSALIGGLIAALANGYFATRIFRPYRAQEPEKLVFSFYGAEIKKLLLTGLMFVGAILWIDPLSIGALFGGYLIIQLVPAVTTVLS
jgi:ATP synthase protein I